METLGCGPANRLKIKVATRNIPLCRDPAVRLIDQLKQIHAAGDTSVWFAKIARAEYSIGVNLPLQSGSGEVDQGAIARDRFR